MAAIPYSPVDGYSCRANGGTPRNSGTYLTYNEHGATAKMSPAWRFFIPSTVDSSTLLAVTFQTEVVNFGGWTPTGDLLIHDEETPDAFSFGATTKPQYFIDNNSTSTRTAFDSALTTDEYFAAISLDVNDLIAAIDDNADHGTTGTYITVFAAAPTASNQQAQLSSAGDADEPILLITDDVVIDVDVDLGVTAGAEAGIATAAAAYSPTFDSYLEEQQVEYTDGTGDATDRYLDVYSPLHTSAADNFWTAWLPGGSYFVSSEDLVQDHQRRSVHALGGSLVTIDYKTTIATGVANTGSNHPEPVQDALCAIGFCLSASRPDLGDRYVLTGHSAGGHLAMQTALFMNDESTYSWQYDNGGNREYNYTAIDGNNFTFDEGSTQRQGLAEPLGVFMWAAPTNFDAVWGYNALARDYIRNYMGGYDNATFWNGYLEGDTGYHSGETNMDDWIRGSGPAGDEELSVWYKPPPHVADPDTGEAVYDMTDSRKLPNFPIGYYEGETDAVIGNGYGNFLTLRDVAEDMGLTAPDATNPPDTSTGDPADGTVHQRVHGADGRADTQGLALNPDGNVSHWRFDSWKTWISVVDSLGHDRVWDTEDANGTGIDATWPYKGWLDSVESGEYVPVVVPAAMAAAVAGYNAEAIITTGGFTTHEAALDLSAVATMAGDATLNRTASLGVTSTASMTADATVIRAAGGAMSTTVALTADATHQEIHEAAAAIAADVAIAAAADHTRAAGGEVSTSAGLTAAATVIRAAGASIDAAVTITAEGTLDVIHESAADLSATAALTADATLIRAAGITITGDVTLAAAKPNVTYATGAAIAATVGIGFAGAGSPSITLKVAPGPIGTTIVYPPKLSITERPVSVIDSMCSNWITTDELVCDISGLDIAVTQNLLDTAVEWLNDATCNQFGGSCLYDLRVTTNCNHGPQSCGNRCDWDRIDLTRFLPSPVTSIAAVEVDGVSVTDADYRLDDRRWFVPTRGGSLVPWPTQNMNETIDQPNTWKITAYAGQEPPRPMKLAAQELTCQLVRRWATGDCDLPDNTTSVSRDGVTISMQTRQDGKIGLPTVDAVIELYGCNKRRRVADPSGRRSTSLRIV